jgi:hypothetical protein
MSGVELELPFYFFVAPLGPADVLLTGMTVVGGLWSGRVLVKKIVGPKFLGCGPQKLVQDREI